MIMRLAAAALVALLVAPGCASSTPAPAAPAPAPTCDDVAAHAKKVVVDAKDAALAPAADQVAAEVRDECTTYRAKQACVLAAVTPQDLVGCRVRVEARGAATCENAVEHAIGLLLRSEEMQQASEEERKMAEGLIAGLRPEMVKECQDKPWTQAQIQCVLDAGAMADLEACDMGSK